MTLKNNRLLITGANGFIGKHLTRRLLREGACVSAFIEPGSPLEYIEWKDVRHYEVDITDKDKVSRFINRIKPKVVFHLSAVTKTDLSLRGLRKAFEVNFLGMANILEAIKHIDCECFVNLSTGEIYGHNTPPFLETQKLDPVSPYSISKAAAEMLCNMYYKMLRFPVVILRPSVVYGPMQSETMLIPQAILAMLRKKKFKMTKGEQTRDFIYVSDVVDALIKASQTEAAKGKVFNLASGKSFSIKEVAIKITNLINKSNVMVGSLSYSPNEIWKSSFNIKKAMRVLRWKPKIDLDSGLKMTVDWYKDRFERGRLS